MKPFIEYPRNVQNLIIDIEHIFMVNKAVKQSDFLIALSFLIKKHKQDKVMEK